MLKEMFENVRNSHPRIHNITNYVTANDCANILLACGAAPVMADDEREVEEFTSICDGLNLNMGTLNVQRLHSMLKAGSRANACNHPIVLDPVGVGVSAFRMEAAQRLCDTLSVAVIKGNASEIRALAFGENMITGVDSAYADQVTEENLSEMVAFVKEFSKTRKIVTVMTGRIDIVADDRNAYCIRNGHPLMASVTGMGCQLSALTAAFVAANQNRILEAVVAAVCTMGVAGEVAYRRMRPMDGNLSYRNYVIDAVYRMTSDQLEKGANYEVR